jgi:hypothetical protein
MAAGGMAAGVAEGGSAEARIRAALHPNEDHRFRWAATSVGMGYFLVIVVLLSTGITSLLGLVPLVAITVVLWRLTAMSNRASLLANAVQVTPASMPELARIVVDTREWLDYQRRVDVYVAPGVDGLATTVSLVGVNVVLLDGAFVANLLDREGDRRLHFLIASSLGTLKARHLRLSLLLLLLGDGRLARLINPFLQAYNRATRYSGDQIAMVCCRSLPAGLEVFSHFMAGPDLVDRVVPGEVLRQASESRANPLARLSEFFAYQPHLAHRYVNLLCFAERALPDQFAEFRERLEPGGRALLDAACATSPHRGVDHQLQYPRPPAHVPDSDLDAAWLPQEWAGTASAVPDDPALGSVHRWDCPPARPGAPFVTVRLYRDPQTMRDGFLRLREDGHTEGRATEREGPWSGPDGPAGDFLLASGRHRMLTWTHHRSCVLVVATGPWTSEQALEWWTWATEQFARRAFRP